MGYNDQDVCNIGLCLGLGYYDKAENGNYHHHQEEEEEEQEKKKKKKTSGNLCMKFDQFFPCLTLGPSEDQVQRQASSLSAVSSFSNSSVKRERDFGGTDQEVEEVEVEVEIERVVSSRASEEDEDGSTRKKLRLTKEQSLVLEDSFKEHTTLNPKQKQVLAKQLNLQPRQVEVWFQNRRARTKLKQTEVDCELLKKCCETLTDENKRLQKELQELKALKLPTPFYMQLPAATLTMCPSCERIGGSSSKSPFTIETKPHFYNPFTHPSATC